MELYEVRDKIHIILYESESAEIMWTSLKNLLDDINEELRDYGVMYIKKGSKKANG